jgi:hypothetical protein
VEAYTNAKQAGKDICECVKKNKDKEKCKEDILHEKYEMYIENNVFLFVLEREYKKCTE